MKISINNIKSTYTESKKISDSKLPFFHRAIIRPLSFYLAIPFIMLGFSANTVTLLSLATGIIGNFLFTLGSYKSMSAAVILILVAIELDFIDGNIARYNNNTSQFGAFLDGSVGIMIYSLIPICLGIGVYNISGKIQRVESIPNLPIIFGAFASIAYIYSNYIGIRYKALSLKFVKRHSMSFGNGTTINKKQNNEHYIRLIIKAITVFNRNVHIPSLTLILFGYIDITLYIFGSIVLVNSLFRLVVTFNKVYHQRFI